MNFKETAAALKALKDRLVELETGPNEPIALIGVGCRFPTIVDLAEFRLFVESDRSLVGPPPPERLQLDPGVPSEAGLLSGVEFFDAAFFGISPRESLCMDPQHRLLLEVAWEAVENAGIPHLRLMGRPGGVFLGLSSRDHRYRSVKDMDEGTDMLASIGSLASMASGRLSYFFGLEGPSQVVDAGSSSGLVAVHQACSSLRRGECDIALAGAVNLVLSSELRRLLPGQSPCEGCVVVVLKRLSAAQGDGDRILALLGGSGKEPWEAPSSLLERLGDAEAVSGLVSLLQAVVQPPPQGRATLVGGSEAGVAVSAPPAPAERAAPSGPVILPLSARSAEALARLAQGCAERLAGEVDWRDFAFTAARRRSHFEVRLAVVGHTRQELIAGLRGDPIQSTCPESLEEARQRYLQGHDLDWKEMSWPGRVVDLPPFPFERQPYWQEARPQARPLETGSHPLLGSHRSHSRLPAVHWWERGLSVSSLSYLRDHRVQEAVVFPGAGYLEMALAAAHELTGSSTLCLEQVHFLEALVLTEEEVPVQLTLIEAPPGRYRFRIFSLPHGAGLWRCHARGAVVARELTESEPWRGVPDGEPMPVEVLYARLAERELYYGPAFRGVRSVERSDGVAQGEVEVPSGGAGRYLAHPVLLDSAFQLLGACYLEDRDTELPVSVDRLILRRRAGGAARARVTRQGEADEVRLWDGQGQPLLEVLGLRRKSLGASQPYLVQQWTEAELPAPAETSRRWRLEGHDPLLAELSRRLETADDQDCTDVLLFQLDLEVGLERIQTLLASGLARRLWLVTRGSQAIGDEPVDPFAAPWWGLGRTLAAESAQLRCTLVDLAPAPYPGELEALLRELQAAELDDEVALRPTGRYLGRLTPFRLPTPLPPRRQPGPGQVEVTLESCQPPGWAGRVTGLPPEGAELCLGQEVVGFSASGQARQMLSAQAVQPRPPQLSPNQAAWLAGPGLVARLALVQQARLLPGEGVAVRWTGAEGEAARAAVTALGGRLVCRDEEADVLLSPAPSETRLRPGGRQICLDSDELGLPLEPFQPDVTLRLCQPVDLVCGQLETSREVLREILAAPYPFAPETAPFGLVVRPEGAYLITGGLGGLGLSAARWLLGLGARHLYLAGRSLAGPEQQRALAELRRGGAEVEAVALDVADRPALQRFLGGLPRPLKGVLHAAGVLADATLPRQSWELFQRTLRPKREGAWNLHQLTKDLDFFVLFSSGASLLGSPGQANYAAANAFLDALAHHRRRQGLCALSVNWGAFAEVGLAAAQENRGQRLEALGVRSFSPDTAWQHLEAFLVNSVPQVGFLPTDWKVWFEAHPRQAARPRFTRLGPSKIGGGGIRSALQALAPEEKVERLSRFVCQQLALVLRLGPGDLDPATPFLSLGVDSLMGLELRNRLETELGVHLPATLLWSHQNPRALSQEIVRRMEGGAEATAIPEAPRTLALSHGQSALWLAHLYDPEGADYNVAVLLRLHTPRASDELARALEQVLARHESLRAVFVTGEDELPEQHVQPQGSSVEIVAAESWTQPQLQAALARDAAEPFELERGVVRARLYVCAHQEHVLSLVMHHIAVDATSMIVILDEWAALCSGRPLDPPPSYAAYVSWQAGLLEGPEGERHWSYWKSQLAGVSGYLEWPGQGGAPGKGRSQVWVPREVVQGLKRLAAQRQASFFMVLAAGLQLALHRLTGQNDLCLGTLTQGRTRPEFTRTVGYFVNPVTLRSRYESGQTFPELLEQTRAAVVGALEHQDYPFSLLVSKLHPPRRSGRTPLLQASLTLESALDRGAAQISQLVEAGRRVQLGDLTVSGEHYLAWGGQFEMDWIAVETGDKLLLQMSYQTDRVSPPTAERLQAELLSILEVAAQVEAV